MVLKTYLTGGESRAVRALIFADMKMEMPTEGGTKATVKEMPADFVIKQEQKNIELLLISVDGVAENATTALDNLPSVDYDFVLEEINKISVPFNPAK